MSATMEKTKIDWDALPAPGAIRTGRLGELWDDYRTCSTRHRDRKHELEEQLEAHKAVVSGASTDSDFVAVAAAQAAIPVFERALASLGHEAHYEHEFSASRRAEYEKAATRYANLRALIQGDRTKESFGHEFRDLSNAQARDKAKEEIRRLAGF